MPLTSVAALPDTGATAPKVTDEGPAGNERLTAVAGTLLLVLFAAQGVTILSVSRLVTWHFFIGLLLVGPICLKLGTTGYRFARYYAGAPAYRRKGPPMPLLRLTAPLVVATTVGVMVTGGALALLGRDTGQVPVLFLHKAFFVCWAGVVGVHVLAYIWRLPRLLGSELRRRPRRHGVVRPRGAAARWSLLALSLAAGLALAFAGTPLAAKWAAEPRHHSAHGHHRAG